MQGQRRSSTGEGSLLFASSAAVLALLRVALHERTAGRGWRRLAVFSCAWAMSLALVLVGEAWSSGSASHFTRLRGHGRSLTEERIRAVGAMLPSGRVLIAGGSNGSDAPSSAEVFDPTTHAFTRLKGSGRSPSQERNGAIAATLRSGKVLIAGGQPGHTMGAVERGTVQPGHRHVHRAQRRQAFAQGSAPGRGRGDAALREGPDRGRRKRAPAARQESFASAELFNPTTDTFTKLKRPGHWLREPRTDAVAATLRSGQVLIAGGFEWSFSNRIAVKSAELFDPTTDTFTKLTSAHQSPTEARYGAVAATLRSGQILIAGGINESTGFVLDAELFDPATDTFTKLTNSGQALTEARVYAVSAPLPSGAVLIAGGSSHGGLSSAELFVAPAQAEHQTRGQEGRRSHAPRSRPAKA